MQNYSLFVHDVYLSVCKQFHELPGEKYIKKPSNNYCVNFENIPIKISKAPRGKRVIFDTIQNNINFEIELYNASSNETFVILGTICANKY